MHLPLFALACMAVVCSSAAAADPYDSPRVAVCLNGEWQRHVGGEVDSVPRDGWETVRVPEYHLNAAKGTAWFRLDFPIPAAMAGSGCRILIRFVRVRHYARVFLNGQLCGENYGMRAPFEVDVTEAARPGESNRLEVWVHDCSDPYAVRGVAVGDDETLKRISTFEGYRDLATIAEDVLLISRPALHVSDVRIVPSVRERTLTLHLTVTNDSASDRDVIVGNAVFLGDRPTLELPPEQIGIPAGKSVQVTAAQRWDDARLWGYPPYGEPVLYHLRTELGEGVDVVDEVVTRFGFREVWTEDGHIMLNGRRLKVLGYWVPEGSGRDLWTARMPAIMSLGCSAIHNHAEQKEPAFYDVADEMGMLVWDANYCGGPLGTTANMTDADFPVVLDELVRQYPMWADATRNHASVVLMMVECLYNHDAAVRLGRAMKEAECAGLLHRGGGMCAPMDMAAYGSNFDFLGDDPLHNIRSTCVPWAQNLRDFQGRRVPLVNKEIWYKFDWRQPPPDDAVAEATADAIDYLTEQDLDGFILYSQMAYQPMPRTRKPIEWPAGSGEGQHRTDVITGGHAWQMQGFVNLADPAQPAVRDRATAGAMREAAPRYLGHTVPVPRTRRPSVLVHVTRDGAPVADAYVHAAPTAGTVDQPMAVRTDGQGRALFQLREAGLYSFACSDGSAWHSVEVDAPLQPLDLARGGIPSPIRAEITIGQEGK
jgi:hypothetical protein